MQVTNITRFQNCNNTDIRSGGYELVSLSGEYAKHLSSVVLNKVNRIHIFLYDLIQINLYNPTILLNRICDLVIYSNKQIHKLLDLFSSIKLIKNNSNPNNITLKRPLVFIIRSLYILSPLMTSLFDILKPLEFYLKGSFSTFRRIDLSSLNRKISEIIKKLNLCITQFIRIECLFNSAKSIIYKITKAKNKLLDLINELETQRMDSVYFKIKYWSSNIDIMFRAVQDAEFHTWCLKYWICKFVNLDASNNLLNRFILTDTILESDIDEICSFINRINFCIYRICNICDSKCTCECKCVTECTRDTICLCLCNGTKPEVKECCICICKKQESGNCKCVCICICNKDCGTPHTCDKCLIKVDIGTLKDQTSKILCYLRWIRCYLWTFNKKCCYCSCCENGWCGSPCCEPCQSIGNYYKSILSWMQWIELLFTQIVTKIRELARLHRVLSSASVIATKCKACPEPSCKDKIKGIIHYISRSIILFDKFGYRMADLRSFVEYKINYSKYKQIIYSLDKSVNPMSKQLKLIYSQILGNVDLTRTSNQLLLGVYSHYNIVECYVVINRLVQCEQMIDQILQLIPWPDGCKCILGLESSNKIEIKLINFQKIIQEITKQTKTNDLKLDQIKNLIQSDIKDNHFCLCMVAKYILYPLIINLVYLMSIDLEALTTLSRKYDRYRLSRGLNFDLGQFFIVCVELLYKVAMYILLKYKYSWEAYEMKIKIKCFCLYSDDPYYPYLISTILFLSSLVEDMWTMDSETMRKTTQKISSLLAEYQSLHVYTNYYTPSRYNIIRFISGLTNGKLIQGALSHSAVAIGERSKSPLLFKSRLSLSTTLSQKEDKRTIFGTLKAQRIGLFEDSLKCGFISVRSMILGTSFSKDKLTLIYNKFSCLCYSCQTKITDGKLDITNLFANIPLEYLNEICKQETCNRNCCQKNGVCKICPIAKIKINCLSISFKDMGLIIANVSGDILLNYLMGSISITEDFITNLCVGFGEVYTIMCKNNLLTHPNYEITVNPLNTVKSRNWGYHTRYEHQATALISHKIMS